MNLRKIFASLVTVTMMVALVPQIASAQTFSDVPSSHTFYNDVEAGVAAGYFSTANSMFNPSMTASRGEMAKMLAVAAGLGDGVSTGHSFTDVPADNVFYPYVMKLANNGIVALNNEFNVELKVTRAELAKMVVGAFGFEEDLTGAPAFSDVASTSDFYTFIHTAKNNGVVNGYTDGTFGPSRNVTRGEAAAFMNRALGSEFGEADHLLLTASSETVAVGDVVVLNASVRDAEGRLVRDAEGAVMFAASTGVLDAASVDLSFGAATTTITSEFAVEDLEITATYGDWAQSVVVDFNIGDNGLGVYLIDDSGYADSDTYGIITLVDENNIPVNGENENFIVDVVKGDSIIEDIVSTTFDGVYMFELSNGGIGATSEEVVVQVEHTTTGRVAQAKFDIEDVVMTVRVANQKISTEQTTPILIFLNQADGTPITGAASDIEVTVLNSEHGTLNTTAANGGVSAVNPDAMTDRGGYIVEFEADNRAANAIIKIRYDAMTPVLIEEVEVEILPYDISVIVPQDTANSYNGYFDVIVMVKDANGMPVNDYPVDSFDLDVTTSARVSDPTDTDRDLGDAGDANWTDADDWAEYAAGGMYTTRVIAVESTVNDSTVEISVKDQRTVNSDVEVNATVAITDPIVSDWYFFEDTAQEFVAFTLSDSEGTAIQGLNVADVLFSGGVASNVAATVMDEFVGGLYFVAVPAGAALQADDDASTATRMTISDEDIEYVTLTGTLEVDAGDYILVGDNSLTNVNGDPVTSIAGFTVAAGEVTNPAALTVTSDNAALASGTLVTPTAASFAGQVRELTGTVVEEVETVTTTVTINTATTKTFSVAPFDVEVVSLDGNSSFVDLTYAAVLVYNRDGGLVNPFTIAAFGDAALDDATLPYSTDEIDQDVTASSVVTLDVDGALSSTEVQVRTLETGIDAIIENAAVANTASDDRSLTPDHCSPTATVACAAGTNVSPAGIFSLVLDRLQSNDDSGEDVEIQVHLYNKDDTYDVFASTMEDVTLDTWAETDTSILRPDVDTLTAGTVDTGGINIYTLVYNDHGVLSTVEDTPLTANTTTGVVPQVIAEGDGDLTFDVTENTAAYAAALAGDDTDILEFNSFVADTELVDEYTGVFWITVETGDSEEEATVSIYPTNNDGNITEISLATVLPTAKLVMLPDGAYFPDADNDEISFVVTLLDQYGNPMSSPSGISFVSGATPAISIEVSGDDVALTETTDFSNTGFDPLGSWYGGSFTGEDEETQDVVVIYNDDNELLETTVEAIFIND